MRHLKIFEDYTEEELRDLQDDLHEIGIKTRFTLGEDFGFNPDFKGENREGTPLRFSKEMFDALQRAGELKTSYASDEGIGARFTNPGKFGVPLADNWVYSTKTVINPNQFFIETYKKEDTEKIAQKFGEVRL